MNKISKIEGLSPDDLKKVFIKIIEQIGFCELTTLQKNIIQCSQINPLGKTSQCFLLISSHLTGSVDMEEISMLIREVQNKSNSNTISIVSPFHISNGFKRQFSKLQENISIEYIDRVNR